MKEYPKMLYKKGGNVVIDKEYFSTIKVKDKNEEKLQLKNGFFLDTLKALKGKKEPVVEEPVVEEPVVEEPVVEEPVVEEVKKQKKTAKKKHINSEFSMI